MPKLDILNQNGEKVGKLELSDHVFGIEPHQQALYDVVTAQRAAMRQGTAAIKNRSEVRGGGKKPWRQKGTGRARQGSIRSPQWRGGGVVFGPTERNYRVKLNKKVKDLAFRSALSALVINQTLLVLDKFESENAKTKDFQNMLNNLKIEGRTLFLTKELDELAMRAGRNIPKTHFANVKHLSVYDLVNAKQVIATKEALEAIEEALGNE